MGLTGCVVQSVKVSFLMLQTIIDHQVQMFSLICFPLFSLFVFSRELRALVQRSPCSRYHEELLHAALSASKSEALSSRETSGSQHRSNLAES